MGEVLVSGLPTASNEFPVSELSDKGLLWLINRVVFHPRGFALALVREEDGSADYFQLQGDGTELHWFAPSDEAERFQAVEATFAAAREFAAAQRDGVSE
jgi:hypothetical protein